MSIKLQETDNFKIVISFAKSLALKSKSNILNPLNVLLGSYVAWKNKEINEDIEFFKNESKALETLAKKNKISLVKVLPEKKQKIDLNPEIKDILKNNLTSSLENFVGDLLAHENLTTKKEEKDKKNIKDIAPIKPEDLTNTYSWKEIEGSDKLKTWSDRLLEATKNKRDREYWDLVGKGVIIINDNNEYCSQITKTVAKESGFNFLSIKKEEISNLPESKVLEKLSPLIIYLETGPWKRYPDNDLTVNKKTELNDIRELVKDRMNDFNSNSPIIFVTSTSDLVVRIADDLKVVGLFDLFISVPDKPILLSGNEFIGELGEDICAPSLLNSVEKVGFLVQSYNKTKRNLTLLALKRLHFEEKRKIEYIDLANAELHDLIEEGLTLKIKHEERLLTAYHEAGHALMAILEFEGMNIPDYTSILPGASGFGGITFQSMGFYINKPLDQRAYSFFKRTVRVALAGRAGEEILVGPINITDGAYSDLKKAFSMSWESFSEKGFSPFMDQPNNSESNLTIVRDTDDPSPSEKAHLENLIRHFLSEEYRVVRGKLVEHKKILDEIAQTLIKDPIVDQDQLVGICERHNLKVIKY